MKGAKRILRAGLLLALLPAAGCLSPHRSAVADVDPLGWREAAEVRFPNADTLAVCDLWLVVRYDAAVRGRAGRSGSDDRRARFAPRDGAFHAAARPLARAVADAVRYAVLYRRRAVLRCAGDYRMTIRPCRPVRGIEAVGVTIEKSI